MKKMSCCSTHTAEDTLEPYQLRALYIRQISRFAQTGLFGQALNVFKEVSLCLIVIKLISSWKVTAREKTTLVPLSYLMTFIGCNAICYFAVLQNSNGIICLFEFTWLHVSKRFTSLYRYNVCLISISVSVTNGTTREVSSEYLKIIAR